MSPFLRLKRDLLPSLGLVNQPIVRAGVDLHHRISARDPVGENCGFTALWSPFRARTHNSLPIQVVNDEGRCHSRPILRRDALLFLSPALGNWASDGSSFTRKEPSMSCPRNLDEAGHGVSISLHQNFT